MPRNWSWLHCTLHTRVNCIERCRAEDVKSISLLTAEAQVGDRFRNVDLAEQIALWSVAAHAFRPVREAGVNDIELLLVGRQGNPVRLHETTASCASRRMTVTS